ncbi:MAG: IPT/TIG domain-containing protein [Acidobacteriota bacterium]
MKISSTVRLILAITAIAFVPMIFDSIIVAQNADDDPGYIYPDPNDPPCPTINSISPAIGAAGTTVTVTITGYDFGVSPTIKIASSAITINYISRSSNQIVATFAISSFAIDGFSKVQVFNGPHVSTNSKDFLVVVPHHLKVIKDQHGIVDRCPEVTARRLTLRVVSAVNNIVGTVPVKEQYSTLTTNTCGNGQPLPAVCENTDRLGTFFDFITTNCPKPGMPLSCGYDIKYQWQWCPSGRSPVNIGFFDERVRANETTVNGYTKPATIPDNTDIFP